MVVLFTSGETMTTLYVYGGSFNPPGLHHEHIVRLLSVRCAGDDQVLVVPCGPRDDKRTTNMIHPMHRAALCDLAFGAIEHVTVDLQDLEQNLFTTTWELDARLRAEFPNMTICHVLGTDLIAGGALNRSPIQSAWEYGCELWEHAHMLIQHRPNVSATDADLPPNAEFMLEPPIRGSSTEIRNRAYRHESFNDLVSAPVRDYLIRHQLYTAFDHDHTTILREPLRPLILHDVTKASVCHLAKLLSNGFFGRTEKPNVIIVIGGDGFMLRAIREHWRRRLPFLGINAGTVGFLLNDLPFEKALARLLSQEILLHVYAQRLLYASYRLTDSTKTLSDIAFNDVLVDRIATQAIHVDLSIEGLLDPKRLIGDGLLLSTAAGSTGYARSMGATPLLIGTPMMILAGSNISSHTWRPAQLPLDAIVSMRLRDTQKRPSRLVVDGNEIGPVHEVSMRTSRVASAELAFLPETNIARKTARLQFLFQG